MGDCQLLQERYCACPLKLLNRAHDGMDLSDLLPIIPVEPFAFKLSWLFPFGGSASRSWRRGCVLRPGSFESWTKMDALHFFGQTALTSKATSG
jgi:hypothetical protein